jgi:hypothetical protein
MNNELWERIALGLGVLLFQLFIAWVFYSKGIDEGKLIGNATCTKQENVALKKYNEQNTIKVQDTSAIESSVAHQTEQIKTIYLTKYKTQYKTIENDYAHMMLKVVTVNDINALKTMFEGN